MHTQKVESSNSISSFVVIYRGLSTHQVLTATEHLLSIGFTTFEVSLTTDNALTTIDCLRKEFKNAATIGAGTIRTVNQLNAASKVGAQLMLSPETNSTVISQSKSVGMLTIPGAFSPTEVSKAYTSGADLVKFFPAGGVNREYFRLLTEPFPEIPFLVTGGLTAELAKQYFEIGAKSVGVGAGLLGGSALLEGNWDVFKEEASKYADTALDGMT